MIRASLKKEIVIAGLAAAILLDLAALAPAQTDRSAAPAPSAGTTGQGAKSRAEPSPARAPVGHFQPSPRELPGLGNEDLSRSKEQIDFDKSHLQGLLSAVYFVQIDCGQKMKARKRRALT